MNEELYRKTLEALKHGKDISGEVKNMKLEELIEELNTYQLELQMQNDELQKKQEELRRSERKFKGLYDALPIALFTVNAEGKILEHNLTAPSLFKTKPNAFEDLNFNKLIHSASQDDFYLKFTEVRKKAVHSDFYAKLKDFKGGYFFAHLHIYILDDIEEVILNITVEDVSAQRRTEDLLKESQMRYKALHDASFGGILLHEKGLVLECNEQLIRLTGYSKEEIGEGGLFQFIDISNHSEVIEKIQSEYEQPYEVLIRTKDGRAIEAIVQAKNMLINDKTVRVAEFRDISAIKKQEQTLAKSEKGLRRALEESKRRESEITEMLGAAREILEFNDFEITSRAIFDACSRVIGARAGYVALLSDDGEENELLFLEDGGMPCTVNPELPMPIRGLREEAYRTGKAVYDNDFMKSEWVKFMPKGHMPLRNVLFAPLNIEGKTKGIMGMACKDGDFTDYDARIAGAFGDYAAIALQNSSIMKSLKDNARELSELNATKDLLFSVIAHDLRGPFTSIYGLSEMLLEKSSQNEFDLIPKLSNSLFKTSKRSLDLLDDLLEWSRVQTGKINFIPADVSLDFILNDVVDLLRANAEAKKIRIEKTCPEISLKADENMLRAIIRNLITNAIKFSYEGSSIWIKAEQNENEVTIGIKDEGTGMSEEQKASLFKVGLQQSYPGTKREKGTGLGLLLSNDFVKMHMGRIEVESTPEKGSVFTVILPL